MKNSPSNPRTKIKWREANIYTHGVVSLHSWYWAYFIILGDNLFSLQRMFFLSSFHPLSISRETNTIFSHEPQPIWPSVIMHTCFLSSSFSIPLSSGVFHISLWIPTKTSLCHFPLVFLSFSLWNMSSPFVLYWMPVLCHYYILVKVTNTVCSL